jgi:hypothetical protein
VHPIRVRSYRPWLTILTALWATGSLALLSPNWSPLWLQLWLALSLTGAVGLFAIGLIRTFRGPPQVTV